MPVNVPHRKFTWWLPDWLLCRAFIGGERWVKKGGPGFEFHPHKVTELALPRLSGHANNDKAYDAYVENAHFAPYAARAYSLLAGLLQMLPLKLEIPDRLKPFVERVSGPDAPVTIWQFAEQIEAELLTNYRCGVLVDYPVIEGPVTVAAASKIYPTMTVYSAEEMVNWRFTTVNGERRLSLMVLHELIEEEDADDPFCAKLIEQWRVLRLVPIAEAQGGQPPADGSSLVYQVEIWRSPDGEGLRKGAAPRQIDRVDVSWPRRAGRYMSAIPFNAAPAGSLDEPEKPILRDVITENVGHFRVSALHRQALLYIGNPQPVITGWDPHEETLPIDRETKEGTAPSKRGGGKAAAPVWTFGSKKVITIKNPDAKASMWSMSAADVAPLSDEKKEHQERIVVMVGNMLRSRGGSNIAERTEKLQRMADHAPLVVIAKDTGEAVTWGLRTTAEWMLEPEASVEKISAAIDATQLMAGLSPADALSLSELVLRGDISLVDLREALRAGGLIAQGRTDEAIDLDIAQAPPRSLVPTGAIE